MSEQPVFERAKTAEEMRLDEAREQGVPWKQWGPYLSERQWGTVREDYSENGDAWTPTIRRVPALTTGVRTASPALATTTSVCVLPLPCGMAETRSSRSGYSA